MLEGVSEIGKVAETGADRLVMVLIVASPSRFPLTGRRGPLCPVPEPRDALGDNYSMTATFTGMVP
ncbi:MAG: hypothetical protein WDO73_32615 [Ignavibacteriota bacterium]